MTKGSWQRPMDKKKFDDSFDRIFGKKAKKDEDACPDCGSKEVHYCIGKTKSYESGLVTSKGSEK